jgi:hypothetical protein
LRDFFEQVGAELAATEPVELDSGYVVQLAPAANGLVGLDVDTGKPVKVKPFYKTIAEKPVIINAGPQKTVIQPQPPSSLDDQPVSSATGPGAKSPVAVPSIRRRIVDT